MRAWAVLIERMIVRGPWIAASLSPVFAGTRPRERGYYGPQLAGVEDPALSKREIGNGTDQDREQISRYKRQMSVVQKRSGDSEIAEK